MATKTDKTPITMNNFRLPHLRLSDFIFGTLRDKVPEKKTYSIGLSELPRTNQVSPGGTEA